MRAIAPWLVAFAVLPQVEEPWPDTIGLEFPFAMATAGGVLAAVFWAHASGARRDEAIRSGVLWGFRLGALLYLMALLDQLISEL